MASPSPEIKSYDPKLAGRNRVAPPFKRLEEFAGLMEERWWSIYDYTVRTAEGTAEKWPDIDELTKANKHVWGLLAELASYRGDDYVVGALIDAIDREKAKAAAQP